MSERRLLGYCGMYCGGCLGHTGVIANAAEEFLKVLDKHEFERTMCAGQHAGDDVHLDVAADNSNAIGFYEHLGFRAVETKPDSILMGLPLR